jgi:S-adenosylmethionine decarboxylase
MAPTFPPPPTQSSSHPTRLPGLHLLGDLYNCCCEPQYFINEALIASTCRQLVKDAGLNPLNDLFHRFGADGGVTGMVVLAESHMSLHTWPESRYVSIDVYVCNHSADNRHKAQQLFDALLAVFRATDPHLWRIDRI